MDMRQSHNSTRRQSTPRLSPIALALSAVVAASRVRRATNKSSILPMRRSLAVAVAVATALLVAAPSNASYSFDNSQIANQALSYPVGTYGGQCRVWAGNVINAVLGANGIGARVGGYGSPGGAYYGAYANAGGALVSLAAAAPGDLVQFIDPNQLTSDYPTGTLHTTIIVARTATPGTFVVKDSNFNLNQLVTHHTMAIGSWAAKNKVSAYVWRFGTASGVAATSDLWFTKTRNTGSGRVEVHNATASSGYAAATVHAASWFSTADQSNGWFQMVGSDLYFIKTKNTGSGHVEVHNATASSGYQSASLHAATWFSTADQSNGWFQMVGSDLYFIKTKNTGSGHVEVHTATAASGYSAGAHYVTRFSTADQNNGFFQMVGNNLFFVKTKNTGSGHVEVHSATASSGYGSGQDNATWLSTGDADNGWFQMVGSDLYFIKTKNTGSGHVEVHTATAASNYQSASAHAASWFSSADADNGWFQMAGSKG